MSRYMLQRKLLTIQKQDPETIIILIFSFYPGQEIIMKINYISVIFRTKFKNEIPI